MEAAFFALALQCGARKAELFGLTSGIGSIWKVGAVRIDRQLTWQYGRVGHAPLKTDKKRKGKASNGVRTVALARETVTLLRAHRAAQAALKMRNRTSFNDRGYASVWNRSISSKSIGRSATR